jgi:hypothetical protein
MSSPPPELPAESFISPVQLTPHFRIASFAVLLIACLSRDLSVERKDAAVGLPLIPRTGVEGSLEGLGYSSTEFDFRCPRTDEGWEENPDGFRYESSLPSELSAGRGSEELGVERDLPAVGLSTSTDRPRLGSSSEYPSCSARDSRSSLRTLENQLLRLVARVLSSPDGKVDDQEDSSGSGVEEDEDESLERSTADCVLRKWFPSIDGGSGSGTEATEASSSGGWGIDVGCLSRRVASAQIPPL